MRKLVVGSRRSKLALTQSQQFIDKLKQVRPELDIEIKEIVTKGDRIVDKQLSKVGGKGLFVKEIQNELFEKQIEEEFDAEKAVFASSFVMIWLLIFLVTITVVVVGVVTDADDF